MRVYEKESPQQLKQRLRCAEEIRMYRSCTVFDILASAVLAGFFLLRIHGYEDMPELRLAMAMTFLLCGLPVPLICLFRTIQIFRKWRHYRFYQVKLSSLHRTLWAGYSYFTVVLDDGEGRKRIVNTHSIFTTHSLFTPHLEDYVGKNAVVGYNEATGQVVFLG